MSTRPGWRAPRAGLRGGFVPPAFAGGGATQRLASAASRPPWPERPPEGVVGPPWPERPPEGVVGPPWPERPPEGRQAWGEAGQWAAAQLSPRRLNGSQRDHTVVMTRYRAVVAYDGAPFHGFAPSPGVETVGGNLETALAQVLGRPVPVTCAGRTDAGVHALGQVVSFDGPDDLDARRLQHSLNRMLAPSIAVRDLEAVAQDFDARFCAINRTYRYQILNADIPDPLRHRAVWHVREHLDIDAIEAAAHHLVGEHNFGTFCRRRIVHVDGAEVEADLTRTVISIEWRRTSEGLLEHWITATAFCHQMVRSITGTLVDVGLGKRSPDSMPALIEARDRQLATFVAPPHALTLWSVAYGS